MSLSPSQAPSLSLSDQLCFPLYAAARAMQRRYRPLLSAVGLTYSQYLVMMVLWERDALSVSELGARLHLDSGTLTPLLKRMGQAGLVERRREGRDGRVVTLHLTEPGRALRARAESVPEAMMAGLHAENPDLEDLDLPALKRSLDQLLRVLQETP